MSLDLSVDSMFIYFSVNFSPDTIYAYPLVFLNPLEFKATSAKEKIVFLFILIQFIVHKPKTNTKRANLSLCKYDSCLNM